MKRVIALILLTAVSCAAKPFWKSKAWWVGEAGIVFANGLDTHSTCQNIGASGVESSLLFSGNRSCGAAIGIGLGSIGFETSMHILEWHVGQNDPKKVFRKLAPWTVPAAVMPIHLQAAAHNYLLQ